jgi:hypothetical protein
MPLTRDRRYLHLYFFPPCTQVRQLVRAGAVVDFADDNRSTPLHLAAFYGHAGAARALIAGGARLTATDSSGRTAEEAIRATQDSALIRLLSVSGSTAASGTGAGEGVGGVEEGATAASTAATAGGNREIGSSPPGSSQYTDPFGPLVTPERRLSIRHRGGPPPPLPALGRGDGDVDSNDPNRQRSQQSRSQIQTHEEEGETSNTDDDFDAYEDVEGGDPDQNVETLDLFDLMTVASEAQARALAESLSRDRKFFVFVFVFILLFS